MLTGGCYIFSIFVVFIASSALKWMLLHSIHYSIPKYIVTGDKCWDTSTLTTQLKDFLSLLWDRACYILSQNCWFYMSKISKSKQFQNQNVFVLFFWKIDHFIQSFMHYLDKLGILSLIVEMAHLGCRKALHIYPRLSDYLKNS